MPRDLTALYNRSVSYNNHETIILYSLTDKMIKSLFALEFTHRMNELFLFKFLLCM